MLKERNCIELLRKGDLMKRKAIAFPLFDIAVNTELPHQYIEDCFNNLNLSFFFFFFCRIEIY